MSDLGIFVIQDDRLVIAKQASFETEDVFQKALADHPDVLAAGATTDGNGGKLLLLRREKGIPITTGGTDYFSVDHLFVDSAGVLVVVEVKRSSDTRLRREVVAQMLDYAANGVKYWTAAELRQEFEGQHGEGRAEKLISDAFPDLSLEDLWDRVDHNLRAKHIRLVFVADRLPDELTTIIEFLNEQMSPAEVLGVELQHFEEENLKVLVPRIVGATSAAKATKQRSTGVPWTVGSFLAVAQERCPAQVPTFQRLFDHAEKRGRLNWGRGQAPGVSGWYRVGDTVRGVWTASTGAPTESPYLYLYLPEIRDLLEDAEYSAFVNKLHSISAFDMELKSAKRKFPSVNLDQLTFGGLEALLAAVESLAAEPQS